jgi:hypothetical protein
MTSAWFALRNAVKTQVNSLTGYETIVSNIPTIDRAELTEPKVLIVPAEAAIAFRNRSSTPKTMALFVALFAPLGTDTSAWDDQAEEYLQVMERIQKELMNSPPEGWRTLEVEWPAPISEDRWRNFSQFSSILRPNFEELA